MITKKQKKVLELEREKTGDLEQKLFERLEKLHEKIDPALRELKKVVKNDQDDKQRTAQ